MKQCALCSKTILFKGVEEGGSIFCSKKCRDASTSQQGFCEKCLSETTSENAGNLNMFNGIGTGFGFTFRKSRCLKCGSVIKRKWFYFGFPIVPMGKYRVINLVNKPGFGSQTRVFLARKLKNTVRGGKE